VTPAARPFRVVLIGPESTGKTWLAERLASTLDVPWSGEFAREFVEANPRPVVFEDVDAIGRGQVANEDAAIARALTAGSPLVIHDTDLVSTEVYSRHYYGDCPPWIPPAAAARLAALYLLHDVDVPWMEDGHMRADPERRHELFELFRGTLARLGASVVLIRGTWDERFHHAVAAIQGSRRP
jgi:NadR type nicotinamide-nucleotide adenylyltransferase